MVGWFGDCSWSGEGSLDRMLSHEHGTAHCTPSSGQVSPSEIFRFNLTPDSELSVLGLAPGLAPGLALVLVFLDSV